MAGNEPYDALGRILAEGGDIQLANAIARGNLRHEMVLLQRWAGWGATPSDIAHVRGIAEQAVSAGRQMSTLELGDDINFSIIPINPMLFGSQGEGLRFYVGTDFQLESTGKWYRGDYRFPDLTTVQDIFAQIDQQTQTMLDKYPGTFLARPNAPRGVADWTIQAIIGRF